MFYFRLHVARDGERGQLVLERMPPDPDAIALPAFEQPERTLLADDIERVVIGYYGRDRDAMQDEDPTWRAQWDDPQRLPLLIRIDITPARAPPWPTLLIEPRRSPEAGCRNWDFARQRCLRT